MLVIPSLNLKGGQCVQLRQGRMSDTVVFSDDPVDVAGRWFDAGARRLHLIDLDGAFSCEPVNSGLIQEIAQRFPNFPIQVGGGIRNIETIELYLNAGVNYVIIGTKAVTDFEFVSDACKEFGGSIMLGFDTMNGKVATEGRTDVSGVDAIALARRFDGEGVSAIVCTDIARDGMMQGMNVNSVVRLAQASSSPVIAAGGVANMNDVRAIKELATLGVSGVVTGRAIYEKTLDIVEAQRYCDH
jgi:phosphoribosylformimino-5-aminoimidazole carboxamide ribotide isomerase